MKQLLTGEDDKLLQQEYKRDLKEQLKKIKELNSLVKISQRKRDTTNDAVVAFQEFNELFQELANYIAKLKNMDDLDFIMRRVFTNFVVEGGKVTKITQNSPFRELCLVADSAMVTLGVNGWNALVGELESWKRFLDTYKLQEVHTA
jgi:phage-related tail protein